MALSRLEPSADALALLAWAGIEWHTGPIPTGLHMIRQYARRVGGWQTPRLPEMTGDLNVEAPSVWDRELTESERDRQWCHLIDKHAAYLGACSSLELGIASPEHTTRPSFDARIPGYWRVDVDPAPWPLLLPDPLGRDVPRRRRREWFTTPTVKLALQQGIELDIPEAWTWPLHRAVLRPFYERCRNARSALEAILAREPSPRRQVAATGALRALKAIYAATLGGGLASLKDRKRDPRPPWYRPDWRHHVIAQARANMLRNLARWATRGMLAAAIYNDGCYVLADEKPEVGQLGTAGLGGYSLKASWPARSMIGRRGRVIPSLAWGEDVP
jgi:hypothetical protein